MNKPTTLAMTLVVAFMGYCGYRAYQLSPDQIQRDIEGSPHYSPNAMHKIQPPFPLPNGGGNIERAIEGAPRYSPHATYRVQPPMPLPNGGGVNPTGVMTMEQIVKESEVPWIVNGVPVGRPIKVTTLDQRTIARAQQRKLRGLYATQ